MKSRTATSESTQNLVAKANVLAHSLADDGTFPNSKLPLLIYRRAVMLPHNEPEILEHLFASNNWSNNWRNGIYPYHHYHSTSHEALGVYQGSATVQLGGDHGVIQQIHAGDVLVIPAGVAHKKLRASNDFAVVGAYPEGRDWDMNYGRPEERPGADENISRIPLPARDPLYGATGPLLHKWKAI